VAASSAVPMLLSPISLRSRAGSCGYEVPPFIEEGLEARLTAPRQYRAARSFSRFSDTKNRFLHLVDGGVSDNLGLRAGIDIIEAAGSFDAALEVMHAELPGQMVVISVDAETSPDPKINLSSSAPGLASMMGAVSGGQIRRYNFETLMLGRDSVADFGRELSTLANPVSAHFVEVSFDLIKGDKASYFKRMPTSFTLSDQQVDDLREAGRRLMAESIEFRHFLEALE
jgi:NTE family protein